MQLVLQVETAKVPDDSRGDILERATEIIRNRIDAFGVQEPMISALFVLRPPCSPSSPI